MPDPRSARHEQHAASVAPHAHFSEENQRATVSASLMPGAPTGVRAVAVKQSHWSTECWVKENSESHLFAGQMPTEEQTQQQSLSATTDIDDAVYLKFCSLLRRQVIRSQRYYILNRGKISVRTIFLKAHNVNCFHQMLPASARRRDIRRSLSSSACPKSPTDWSFLSVSPLFPVGSESP